MNRNLIFRTVRLSVLVLFVLANFLLVQRETSAIGSFGWAGNIGGTVEEAVYGVAVDSAGNVYATGWFSGTADFDPGPGTFNLTSVGSADVFLSKVDSNGSFVWARSIGGAASEDIAADASGNVYTTGYFSGTVDFDPGPGIFNLTSTVNSDMFVLKLDGDGNLVWARDTDGGSSEYSLSLGLDSSGNVYTGGYFNGTADFDPGPGIANLTSAGSAEIFISKLDSNGNYVWAGRIGGTGEDASHDIAVDASGNVYATGWFTGTADFDPGPGTFNLTSDGFNETFIFNLDSNGSLVWVRKTGGILSENGAHIAVDSGGNVFTSSFFFDTSDFDPGPGVVNLTSAGDGDIFVSKLDSSGNFLWARGMGGVGFDWSRNLAVDPGGNVYTTGMFSGSADFDPGGGTANLTGAGSGDIFVSKLDGNGNYVWARSMGGADFDEGEDIAIDSSLHIYVTGPFRGTADFDPGAGMTNLTSAGMEDIFIAKFQDVAVFADVPSGYWAGAFIERLYMAGITGGCATSPLRYCPEDTVTRAQMAVFLLRGIHTSAYIPPTVNTSTGFGDVPVDYWAATFVKQLAAEGITSGCGGGNYCPENPVTRAQMAVFLLKAKHGASYVPPAVGSGTGFGDVPADYWAGAFIKQLVTEGITAGCGSGNYCPEQPVTRAQMAVFLVRAFNLP